MSLHFYPLTIQQVQQETDDCISVAFNIPDDLKNVFTYKHGQNITLKATINGEELRRSYSLCSSPLSNDFRVAIKQLNNGLFSSYAHKNFKKGDVVEVMPAVGNFYTELDKNNTKNYVAFVAGSGITPILSIATTILLTEPNSNFTLIYGNKNSNSIIFKEEIDALKNSFLHRFQLMHILSREVSEFPVFTGRINKEKLQQLASVINYNKVDEFFICGPQEMIFTIKNYLEDIKIDVKKIHFEIFVPAPSSKTLVNNEVVANDNTPACNVVIKADGRSFDFKLPFNNTNILDGALQNGADLPFACKGGMCCTCKAKLVEGEVKMDVHWGLGADEIQQGFILTCQSKPVTDTIVVDFDVK